MKIATWNLDHASNSSRPVTAQIQQLERINADILVLTETCERVDLRTLGYKSVLPHHKNRYGKYWSVIWSRWPISQQIDCYDNETAVCARIASPLGDLIIYGTIITWKNDPGSDPEVKSPAWSEHEKSILEHGIDWRAIQNGQPGIPFVVAGDFNQTRDGSKVYCSPNGIRLLNEQLERNSLVCVTDEDFGANMKLAPDPQKSGRYRHNVDHICVSKSLLKAEYVGAWDHFRNGEVLSDHNGVFAELTKI
ncbi:MAG TPA: endonuclease/exonuclease/phosphatase family protein [Candidatus Paceibacterota bacterium]